MICLKNVMQMLEYLSVALRAAISLSRSGLKEELKRFPNARIVGVRKSQKITARGSLWIDVLKKFCKILGIRRCDVRFMWTPRQLPLQQA